MQLLWVKIVKRVAMGTLGNKIKEIRGKESRAEFAQRHNIHPNTLQRWENDERQPELGFLRQLITEYKISPEWLLLDQGEAGIPEVLPGVSMTVASTHYINLIDNFNEIRKENSALWTKIEKLTRDNGELRIEIERLKNQINK